MIEYTGHPFVDVGIATIAAFCGKRDPTELTAADFQTVADYIMHQYVRQPLKSFLTVAFPNSGFTQPAFDKSPEKRIEYAQRVLYSYRNSTPLLDERCVFTGEPAAGIAFGDKEGLPPGRAFRQHMPLLTGEGVINFHPDGNAGLPVSGGAILAIQALPLGCAKCGGRLLAVHSDNDKITLHYANESLKANRRSIQLAQIAGTKKMEESHRSYRTLLIERLLNADQMQDDYRDEEEAFSITAYHFSNSGQGAGLDIYHLPLQITAFLCDMQGVDYRDAWNAMVHRAWQTAPSRRKPGEPFIPRRNWVYEDLFQLPVNAQRFLRTHFLGQALRYVRDDSGETQEADTQPAQVDLEIWKITERFLWRILNMDKERIELIRKMGDRLADYVSSENDRRFFQQFVNQRRYDYLRMLLIKANLAHVKRGNPPIITLDPYIEVFEEGDHMERTDWRLGRDLVLLRMVERLYEQGWLGHHADAIPEVVSDEGTE